MPVATRVLYSSVAALRHPSAWLTCIACLKVRGSGKEAEFACSPSSSSSSDHITGGSASGPAECLTFHHSPGGHEMCDVQRRSCAGAGRGAWTIPGNAGGLGVRCFVYLDIPAFFLLVKNSSGPIIIYSNVACDEAVPYQAADNDGHTKSG